jgi:hypothetical protein
VTAAGCGRRGRLGLGSAGGRTDSDGCSPTTSAAGVTAASGSGLLLARGPARPGGRRRLLLTGRPLGARRRRRRLPLGPGTEKAAAASHGHGAAAAATSGLGTLRYMISYMIS